MSACGGARSVGLALLALSALLTLLYGMSLVSSDTDLPMMMKWCWWIVYVAGGGALFSAAQLGMSWYELRRCRTRVNELRKNAAA